MSLIQVTDLTFAYDGSYDNVFEHTSFQIDTRWKLGFIGRNGRGKTTFLNLLMGQYTYTGTISASCDFSYFPYEVPDPGQCTHEVAVAMAPDFQLWKLQRELSLLEVDEGVLYRPFETLSSGEQTKVLLAIVFLRENRFLLIDEPTNHLDLHGREVLGRYLQSKEGFILVSHDRSFLDSCVDHILSMNRADIEVQKGNFSSWWHNRQLQDEFELFQNERLKQDIRRMEDAARRTCNWSDQVEKTKLGTRNSGLRPDRGFIGHKSAKMMKRSKSMENRRDAAVEEKKGLLKNLETTEPLKLRPLAHPQKRLVHLEDVSLSYGKTSVLRGVNLTIEQGSRVALRGKNGAGKSTLLKLVCGQLQPSGGMVRLASGLIVSYVKQEAADLSGSFRDFIAASSIDETLFKAILRKLDFARVQFEKDLQNLSGGQKKKVLLARSLCQQAHLYVWDEPLNYIDVLSRVQVEQLLLEFRPTLLFVEHDKTFCESVSTDTFWL